MARARGGWKRVGLIVLVASVLVAAAVYVAPRVGRRLALLQIDRHEWAWQRARPSDYRYEIETVCFCSGQLTFAVVVADGRVVAVDPEPVALERALSIDEVFDVARDAVRRGAASVDVDYAADGHPTRVSIDEIEHGIDDEVAYVVRDLMPTKDS